MNDPMSIVMCLPEGTGPFDPNPDETARRDLDLRTDWSPDTRGVVGWSSGGWDALRLAAAHPDLPRLVLIAVPFADPPPDLQLDAVAAKTLLLYGTADPETGNRHATLWQRRLATARVEMVPGGTHELLVPMWARTLSHLAPRRTAG